MENNTIVNEISPEAIGSLRLPPAFDETVYEKSLEIDAFLKQGERSADAMDTKIAALREAGRSHLGSYHAKQIFEIEWLNWPPSLFIPRGADARNYWIGPAPDDHRYTLAWTGPATATANRASPEDGTLFSFSSIDNGNASRSQSSESGVGVFFQPSMTLGTIDFQPQVHCSGTLRTFLEFYPQLAAGAVEVQAQLLLAAWQLIPGGFDLLGFKPFVVATTGKKDQSYGPRLDPFQRSYHGSGLSATFVVQRGRTYLLGVVSRVSAVSTLTSTTGEPLAPVSNTMLRVWGAMNSVIPQMNVWKKRVDIP